MVKKFSVLMVALCLSVMVWSQSKDSLTFVNANWEVTPIAKGITLKQFHFTGDNQIFESSQYISIIEIDTKKAKGRFALANDPGKITQTSKFAKDSGAVVAMNGTFYNMSKPYNSVSFFRKYGEVCYEFTEKMEQRDNGAVVISKKGKTSIAYAPIDEKGLVLQSDWAKDIKAPHVMGSGPALLKKGKQRPLIENLFNKNRHPRSAMATYKKKIYLITVDGRATGVADGVSLWELISIMRYLGVKDALNLDGGGSTTLYVKDAPDNGIVNHPSDNRKFDRQGERFVVNSLLFISR